MEAHVVECLCCGEQRVVVRSGRLEAPGECGRCGYLGWARSDSLTEETRRLLRERPPERRRPVLRAA
jgi:hypothetical protein